MVRATIIFPTSPTARSAPRPPSEPTQLSQGRVDLASAARLNRSTHRQTDGPWKRQDHKPTQTDDWRYTFLLRNSAICECRDRFGLPGALSTDRTAIMVDGSIGYGC